MGLGTFITTVVTNRKNIRLTKKVQEYEAARYRLRRALDEHRRAEDAIRPLMQNLEETRKKGIRLLRRARKLVAHGKLADNREAIRSALVTADRFAAAELAGTPKARMGVVQGVVLGTVAGGGSSALVYEFGVSSTGLAISKMGGTAAVKATVAWFAGGLAAATGAGVLLGSCVLSGIVIVPAAALGIRRLNVEASQRIKEVEYRLLEIEDAIYRLEKTSYAYGVGAERCRQLSLSVAEANASFLREYRATCKRLYRWPIFSRIYRWLRRLQTGFSVSSSESPFIQPLETAASNLAGLLSEKVFDPYANVSIGRAELLPLSSGVV